MKKTMIKRGLAILLTSIISVSSAPVSAFASQTISSDPCQTTVNTKATAIDGMVYATVNMPYADFYYGELNNISVGNSSVPDLSVADPVSAAGYRDSGYYDAVSSATSTISRKFPTTYYAANGSGTDVYGLANVQIAIPVDLYNNILTSEANGETCSNKLYDFVDSMTLSDTAFSEYKVLNADGTFSKMISETTVADDAVATITTDSVWGQYQIDIEDLGISDADLLNSMLGVVFEAKDNSGNISYYGMTHVANLWLVPTEMSFAISDFTEAKGNTISYKYSQGLEGKTITKITYLVKNGSDIVVNTNLPVKMLTSKNYPDASVSASDVAISSNDMVTSLTASGLPDGYDLDLSQLSYNGVILDPSTYSYNKAKATITLKSGNTWDLGAYTATFSDDVNSDISATFNLTSGLTEQDVSVTNNVLSLNSSYYTISDYMNAISEVYVNGTSIRGASGATLFNTDGSINFAGQARFHAFLTSYFANGESDDYTIKIVAPGFPDLTAKVGNSYTVSSVSLDKADLSLYTQGTSQLTATTAPDTTKGNAFVSWTSSNPSVATVSDSGLVTGVSSGQTVITAKSGLYTATCTVTVAANYSEEYVEKTATFTSDGQLAKKDLSNGEVIPTSVIAKIKSASLSQTSYTSNGKTQAPSVILKDSNGKTIPSAYYTLSYSNIKSSVPGQYTVTVKCKGRYSGSKTLTYQILPQKTSLSVKAVSKTSILASYTKISNVSGYEIQYSTTKTFKNIKRIEASSKASSKTISKLTKNKIYYVRIRAYKTVTSSGKSSKLYADWSAVKKIKTKK